MGNANCFGICSLLLCALSVQPANQAVRLKAGSSFGMCAGYCFKEVQITGTSVAWTLRSTRSPQKLPTRKISGTISGTELRDLLGVLNRKALTALADVIGCPDCADGGAEWVEATFADGATKKVSFEFGKSPPAIEGLVEKLRAIRDKVPAR